MTKSELDFDAWNAHLAVAVAALGDEIFAARLYDALAVLAPHDDPIIWFYPLGQAPCAADTRGQMADTGDVEAFLKGPYLLDPFYLAGAEQIAEGFYRLADLAPATFRDSEYYRSYYVRIHMIDEAGYIVYDNDGGFANISFGRKGNQTPFSDRELSRLRSVAGVVCQLMRQHMARLNPTPTIDSGERNLPQYLKSGLAHFGASLLTEREQEVIHLFLRGHSTKSAAERLGISPETIKLHRKNSYAKLDVASQAELFVLFIDSMAQSGPRPGEDPLICYLAVPP